MKTLRALRLLTAALALWAALGRGEMHAATVVIDAGHGGHDRGGVPSQKAAEKTVTLSLALRVASKLRAAGLHVVLTRSSDTFVGLTQRCRIANAQRNAVFLSIHTNSAPRLSATGVETYYYSSRSASLASAVHREVLRVMGTENRGIRQRGFYVIRHTSCPAVLVEPGFLTNAAEARRLTSSSFQDALASALARAVLSVAH